ncbi:MAG: DUF2971 domain-containing protein [Bifidobacteriaceae bacterium]|jgi:hypothetical protein|nr:DUF2971 domain-containing protein [Bifidobacteriaceae bacterium]
MSEEVMLWSWDDPFFKDLDGPIYHYTTASALKSIVEHDELWAMEASSESDKYEVAYGRELVEGWLGDQNERRSQVQEQYVRAALELVHSGVLPTRQDDVFVLSASLDDDDMTQWDRYASGGNGFMLGIDPKADLSAKRLKSSYDLPRAGAFQDGMVVSSGWNRVVYGDDQAKRLLNSLLEHVESEDGRIKPTGPLVLEKHPIFTHFVNALVVLMSLIKKWAFRNEHEVRYVVHVLDSGVYSETKCIGGSIRRHVALEGPIRSIVPEDHAPETRVTKHWRHLPISSVMMGPNCSSTMAGVHQLLEETFYPGDFDTCEEIGVSSARAAA